jgi:hypothetical protein
MVIRRLGVQFEHTLGYGGPGVEGDLPLECRQQDAYYLLLFLARIEFSVLRKKRKKRLCSGKNEGKHRCDLSAIP